MNSLFSFIRLDHIKWLILSLLYGVGLAAHIWLPENNLWEQSWFILLISFLLVYPFQSSLRYHLVSSMIIALGFAIEWLGVKTGVIFGAYHYGTNLGWTLDGIPPVIGLNWWIVVVGSLSFSQLLFPKFKSPWIIAPVFLLFLDFFLEQLAPDLGFWYWEGSVVPVQNYLAWALVGMGFSWMIYRTSPRRHLIQPGTLYLIQLLFFGSLYLIKSCC